MTKFDFLGQLRFRLYCNAVFDCIVLLGLPSLHCPDTSSNCQTPTDNNDTSPHSLLALASAKTKKEFTSALLATLREIKRRQNLRRSHSAFYDAAIDSQDLGAGTTMTIQELDKWMEALTLEHSPMEVRSMIVEEGTG